MRTAGKPDAISSNWENTMGTRNTILSAVLLLAALLILGCGNDDEPEPTVTPSDTPVPAVATAEPAQPATDTPAPPPTDTPAPPAPEPTTAPDESSAPTDWERFEDVERGIGIDYPTGWLVVEPSVDALTDLLGELGDTVNSDDLANTFELLIQSPDQLENFVALAFEIDEEVGADVSYLNNFTTLVVPSDGLTLDLYMALVSEQLSEVDGIEVERSEVVSDLRGDGLETSSIEYVVDGSLYGIEGLQVRGWQVAMLNRDGSQLLVFTFGTQLEDAERLAPAQRWILMQVDF